MRLRAVVFGCVLAGLSIGSAAADSSWWNDDWKFRKELSFDLSPAGADIAGSAQEVPVLVRLSLANFSYFDDAKPDGADFRVVAGDDKTPLKFHFERYDAQTQMAFLWVRMPQLTGASNQEKAYVYYGNPAAEAAGSPADTYDVAQSLALHLGESTGLPLDSTAYKNAAATSSAELTSASLIGGGAKFNGSQSISLPASASLRVLPNQGFTATAWIKIDQPQQQAYVLAFEDAGKELVLGIDGLHAFARAGAGAAPVTIAQTTGELTTGQWHHLALTAVAGQLSLYVDGAAVAAGPAALEEIGGTLTIGGAARGSSFLIGELDEVGVAKTARAAEWIKAVARSEGMVAPLVVYGADGQKEGGQGSYFGTIARNLTVDGWVVIGICMFMLAVALVIMLLKAILLSRVEKTNAEFMRDFHRLGDDTTALDHAVSRDREEFEDRSPFMSALAGGVDKYGPSSIYRVYHTGVVELKKRVAGGTVSAKRVTTLSAQSIEAIRASMDATMTRQQQRLSAQMVLLTIAISGGPFLGLLGTVIGVMITFAAIALSGDVNVNAIAPGTAAALAATVAGLTVAIPALFGYNWLNTRIKSITADNRVFVDEFVARLAEQYS